VIAISLGWLLATRFARQRSGQGLERGEEQWFHPFHDSSFGSRPRRRNSKGRKRLSIIRLIAGFSMSSSSGLLIFILIYMNLDLSLGNKFSNLHPKWEDMGDILSKLFPSGLELFLRVGVDAIGAPYTFAVSVVYQIFQTFGIAFIGTLVAADHRPSFWLIGLA
jgi:hypothetical protein